MKKIVITLIIISLFFVYFLYFLGFDKFNLFRYLQIINYEHKNIFYTLLFLSNLILLLTPFPATVILIINGFYFGYLGNLISLFFILLTASVLFFISGNIYKKKFSLITDSISYKKYINIFDKNKIYILFGLRYLVPHFFHSLISGITGVKFYKFFIIITLAEIPGIFAMNAVGSSIKNFTELQNKNFKSIFVDSNFFIPFFAIIIIYFVYRYFEKKINLKDKK